MLPLALVIACASPPDPCASMCDAAATLYGGCLADWGVGWEAAGYVDEDDFLGACQTWAWEQRLLEADAADRGLTEVGGVDATCTDRAASFDAAAADPDALDCNAYTGIDWNQPGW